ncbi:MAG: vitamin K epoxide reductase family protein [Chloroflexi bacterium]|nr:vitamin K epoxide reductase family protein [Chloroflexota bacterium]
MDNGSDSESEVAAIVGRPSKLWLFIALLGITGLAVTTYLTSNALAHTEVGCSISGCNTVLGSKWSKIFGIPVSAFGMATYAIIMLGAFHAYQSPIDDLRGRRVVALTAGIGVLASIYLTTIEFFVIKAACQYCITSAVLVVVVAVTLIIAARKEGPLWAAIRRRPD